MFFYQLMNKRGQFYLIAAIIIIVIIFGIYTAGNYVKTKQEKTIVYDLKKEFGLESGKIDDFALYNSYNSGTYLDTWIETYVNTRGQSLDNFVVVYGDGTDLKMKRYSRNSSGGVCLSGGCLWTTSIINGETSSIDENKFEITLGNIVYPFTLEPGKNFLFIIKEGNVVA